ncbi:guanylate kinase [Candidatus Gracilibacteria bacterium]|nr:MAG: guanylate kinase [Candidatus Gracilibacteria bacterium]PIE84975.1 MAG: guanylate kinase [Candidatus Gracilibacteria bacterium]
MEKGHIYFIMGPSGSGKGTLRKNLENENLENIKFLKSYVSRPMRPGEKDGDIYNFISKEDFLKGIEAGEFLEYALVHKKHYYGTKYDDIITNGINKGRKVIKELDINGLLKLKKQRPELSNDYTSIFLNLPLDKLRERIYSRGHDMSESEFQNRLDSAKNEYLYALDYCDFIVNANQTPQEVLEEVKKIIF